MTTVLGEIISLVLRVISIVTGIQSIVNAIQGNTLQAAQETTPFLIQDDVHNTEQTVDDLTWGNAALKTLMDTNQAAVLAAIAAIPPPITPPAFPTTFPPGWGAGTASSVWGSQLGVGMLPASQYLLWTAWNARFRSEIEEPIFSPQVDYPWVLLGDYTVDGQQDPATGTTVTLDFSTILASDATCADWLFRVYPSTPWTTFTNGILGVADPGANTFFWGVWLPQDKWVELKDALGLGPTVPLDPPVWPGLARVVLGTSLPLSDGLVIPGPLDGVLVTITAVAYPVSFYPFGTLKSYVHAGGLVFIDDNGQGEAAQSIGLETNVICPKVMKSADHAILRLTTGVVGTIQPWALA